MNILLKASLTACTVATIAVTAMMGPGCGGKSRPLAGSDTIAPAVVVTEIEQRTVPIYSEFVGQTRAIETVELRARVEGILEKIHFKEGEPIRKGDLLFTIDRRPFE